MAPENDNFKIGDCTLASCTKNEGRSILGRMIRIYRMWRFIKVVEHFNIGLRKEYADPVECSVKFQNLKTIFGRHYTVEDAYTAIAMALRDEYIQGSDKSAELPDDIQVTGKGLRFNSYTGLINELAGAVAKVGALTAVVISVLAFIFSIYTAHQKPVTPVFAPVIKQPVINVQIPQQVTSPTSGKTTQQAGQ